ncbi:MAG TPA: hypothetical protein VG940_08480 [Gemmatimonadales bacterium]|nr:hypothetical protein [Gemmatimonadales bacterium]
MTVPEMIQVMAVAAMLLVGIGVAGTLLRMLWRRTDRMHAPGGVDLAELQARVAELEAERGRVAELEERLDFAERLLAKQGETAQLPRAR